MLALVLVSTTARSAHAGDTAASGDPLNSSDTAGRDPEEASVAGKTEVNVVPVVGGSTDVGVGGGAFIGIARVKRGYAPYLWNLEGAGTITFLPKNGSVESPYQDVYAKLTIPRFLGAPMQLELRPSYTWEQTLGYYGVGNASGATAPAGKGSDYFMYGRMHPAGDVLGRIRIVDHVAAVVGARYTHNWIQFADDSKLAADMKSTDAETQSLLGPTSPHSVVLFRYGLQLDTRDDETSTHSGTFDEASLKLSPGGIESMPYRYGQANFTGRVFVPIWRPRITLATRFVFDALFGDPPFYELSRFDDTYALGGANGVRGIPAQRYSGKIKAFGNAELRTELVTFHALKKEMTFGAVAFFDAGRLWADWKSEPALDGTGIGLKYGTGGGLRLQSGQAFVIRLDVAWSPDATPIGAYFGAGQVF